MSVHLDIAVQRLKNHLLGLAAFVEQQVKDAVTAFVQRNESLAQSVIGKDSHVDQRELDIEEDCLKILALYQPVAADLRFVISVLKINNDLERIGDLAVNIAERAASLAHEPRGRDSIDYSLMANKTMEMLRLALDALIGSDSDKARKVCDSDSEVDDMHISNYTRISKLLSEHADQASAIIQLLSISRYLERIADLATNIAEDVVYLVEGKITRRKEKPKGVQQKQ